MAVNTVIGGIGTGDLFVGEDKQFKLFPVTDRYSGVPVNMTGWTVMFVVRKTPTTADPPIFSKVCTIAGIYNVDPTQNTQYAYATLTQAELNTVKQAGYVYSFKRTDPGSNVVLAWGTFLPERTTQT